MGLTDADPKDATMLKTYASRVVARAVIVAALAAGSLTLAATAASASECVSNICGSPPAPAAASCPDSDCNHGPPPGLHQLPAINRGNDLIR